MRFPKAELDIDEYRQAICNLLSSGECHIFIDTNIISQLYKLNDKAREDFLNWVSTVSPRFHIPNWVAHEYHKRYVSQKTKEYLSELDNSDIVKRIKNLSFFAKGYVGDSLLVGSEYQGDKDGLFRDLDDISRKFEKIHGAITKKLEEHQLNVHKDILENLGKYSLSTDLYSILRDIEGDGKVRYSHLVPPGFEDLGKETNCYGDLIIWREILSFCKDNSVSKAIWITRDGKTDLVYTPQRQYSGGRPSNSRKAIAHESLVFEFSQKTHGEDFYIIDFLTLAECLADSYQTLARSFQIVTASDQVGSLENTNLPLSQSQQQIDKCEDIPNSCDGTVKAPSDIAIICAEEGDSSIAPERNQSSARMYSERALADKDCESWCSDPQINHVIEGLRSYNWYTQNDVINYLKEKELGREPSSALGLDMFFVLGRNIYQSAVGSAFGAIDFLDCLDDSLNGWDEGNKQALVDGMLYEVFFDSEGKIRPKSFKAKYFQLLLNGIDLLSLDSPYGFINSCLMNEMEKRFVPEVHNDDKTYSFIFECESVSDDGEAVIRRLTINGKDASGTFTDDSFYAQFAEREELEAKLSVYYAIPEEQIIIEKIDPKAKTLFFIGSYIDF